MAQMCTLGLWVTALVLPGQADIGNGFVGITSDLGVGVNTSWTEWAPQISADGLTLLYSSDISGGFGGWDLYMATRSDRTSKFEKVENLGPPINTSTDEYMGVLTREGKELIFVRLGSGDLVNLWMSSRSDPAEPFEPPVSLDAVNGTYGAGSPSLSPDERRLFFASARPSLQVRSRARSR
jgi:Tol biopolymer transport system component